MVRSPLETTECTGTGNLLTVGVVRGTGSVQLGGVSIVGGWTGGSDQRVTKAHGRGAIELQAARHFIVPVCYAHGSRD